MLQAIILAVFLFLVLIGSSQPSNAQFLSDEANLKIIKVRANLLHQNKANLLDDIENKLGDLTSLSSKVNCGSVDIGNTISTNGIGRDVSIIITGDIINTDNRCITK